MPGGHGTFVRGLGGAGASCFGVDRSGRDGAPLRETVEALGELLGVARRVGERAHVGRVGAGGRRRRGGVLLLATHLAQPRLGLPGALALAGEALLGRGHRVLRGLGLRLRVLAAPSGVVDRAVGAHLSLATGTPLVTQLRLEALDLALRDVARRLGTPARLVGRGVLHLAGPRVVVALLLDPLPVERGVREPDAERPALRPRRVQHRREQREIRLRQRGLDTPQRARRGPPLEHPGGLAALEEPRGDPLAERAVDVERAVQLLTGRAAAQPPGVEAGERPQDRGEVVVVPGDRRRRRVEQRCEQGLRQRQRLVRRGHGHLLTRGRHSLTTPRPVPPPGAARSRPRSRRTSGTPPLRPAR